MAHAGGTKAIIAALGANVGIAIAKFVGWLITGSSAMLAEGIHSIADSGNQLLLLLGGRWSLKPADDIHQFGYGRERYFSAFIVSLVLFSLGAVFSVYEGIHKLTHPHKPENLLVAVAILGIAVILESYSFYTAVKESNELRGDKHMWEFIRTTRNPELPVVFLEDAGALLGLVIALISVLLSNYVNPIFDAIGTLFIGGLLGTIATILAKETKSMLIGEGATKSQTMMMRRIVSDKREVRQLIHMRTLHTAPEEFLVAIKIECDHSMDFNQIAALINEIEKDIRDTIPEAKYIFIEPGYDERASSLPPQQKTTDL